MNQPYHREIRKPLLAASLAITACLATVSANAWWGPVGPYAGGWDPQEAYLDEYGFFDRFGPSRSDIRRMHRDNWQAWRGYPVYRSGLGRYGPTLSDIRRQQHRKTRRFWGYPY